MVLLALWSALEAAPPTSRSALLLLPPSSEVASIRAEAVEAALAEANCTRAAAAASQSDRPEDELERRRYEQGGLTELQVRLAHDELARLLSQAHHSAPA